MASEMVENLILTLDQDKITGLNNDEIAAFTGLEESDLQTLVAGYRSNKYTILERILITTSNPEDAFFNQCSRLLSLIPVALLALDSTRLTLLLLRNNNYHYANQLLRAIGKVGVTAHFLNPAAADEFLSGAENLAQKSWRCHELRLIGNEFKQEQNSLQEKLKQTVEENRQLRAALTTSETKYQTLYATLVTVQAELDTLRSIGTPPATRQWMFSPDDYNAIKRQALNVTVEEQGAALLEKSHAILRGRAVSPLKDTLQLNRESVSSEAMSAEKASDIDRLLMPPPPPRLPTHPPRTASSLSDTAPMLVFGGPMGSITPTLFRKRRADQELERGQSFQRINEDQPSVPAPEIGPG